MLSKCITHPLRHFYYFKEKGDHHMPLQNPPGTDSPSASTTHKRYHWLPPVFAICHPFLFTAIYTLAGWLFIKVRVGWRFQMWALERPSPSQQAQLSQFQLRLTLYQTVFLSCGDNHRLFTRCNKNVTLNEDERCAGSMIAAQAFLRTAY